MTAGGWQDHVRLVTPVARFGTTGRVGSGDRVKRVVSRWTVSPVDTAATKNNRTWQEELAIGNRATQTRRGGQAGYVVALGHGLQDPCWCRRSKLTAIASSALA